MVTQYTFSELHIFCKFVIFSALSECERRGDFCPRGASCEKKSDGSYNCVCKSGLKIADRPRGQNKKCEGNPRAEI